MNGLYLLLFIWGQFALAKPGSPPVVISRISKADYAQARKQSPGFGEAMKDKMTFPVKKQRHKLVVPTAAGNKVFRDKIVANDEVENIIYSYLGFFPKLHQHVIEIAYWESYEWLIVEENGNMVKLVSPPNYSPTRRSIVAASRGINYEMMPNQVQVFVTRNNKLALGWEITPELWEPVEIFWGNDSTFFVKKEQFRYNDSSADRYRVPYKPARFTYSKIVLK